MIQTVGGPDMASRYVRQSFIVIICRLITEVRGGGGGGEVDAICFIDWITVMSRTLHLLLTFMLCLCFT